MAFPWIFECNFEDPTTPFGWDSETDTGSKLDVPRYYQLSEIPGLEVPFRGASCLRIDLRSGDTNDHTVTEGDIDIADAATRWFRLYLYVSPDFAASADDTFNILELQQGGGTVECSLGLRITASTDAVEIGIGDGTAPTSFVALSKGVWHCVEWKVKISTSDAGTQDLYLDGSGSIIALSSLDNGAAVGQGVLGTQDTLATTTGTILIDQFVMDDAQIYPLAERWPWSQILTQSGHVFVGRGNVDSVAILSTGADNTCAFYDTDTATVRDASARHIELDASASTTFASGEQRIHFERGCYAVLGGTSPRVQVVTSRASDGPTAYGSTGAIRQYGAKRIGRSHNV